MKRLILLLSLALLAGCAQPPRAQGGAQSPLLQLPPAALGRDIAVQQRLGFAAPRQSPRTLDVWLEADAQSVRMALMQMGQVAARLVWDGTAMQVTQSRWWPAEVSAARILSDVQLALWPAAAVQQALPTPWRLQEQGALRVLLHGDERVIEVRRLTPVLTEIAYLREGWVLRIESEAPVGEAVP